MICIIICVIRTIKCNILPIRCIISTNKGVDIVELSYQLLKRSQLKQIQSFLAYTS
jgi:hypothetical protein